MTPMAALHTMRRESVSMPIAKEMQMASCHEMKMGQVYVCEGCGLELQVVKEC